jgi:hypothetical protein
MKNFLLAILLLLSVTLGHAAQVTVSWGTIIDPSIAKYKVYATTNKVVTKVVEVGVKEYPNNQAIFLIETGVPYKFYVTSVNQYHLESDPSPEVPFTAPVGLPPEVKFNLTIDELRKDKQWKGIRLNWAPSPPSYGVTGYIVNFESGSSTGRYTTKSNVFYMSSMPVVDHKIFVNAVNTLGSSPVTTNSIINLDSQNTKRVMQVFTK